MSYFIPPASVKKSSCTVLNHQNCSRYLLVNRKASTVQINKIIKLSRKFIETKGEFTNPPMRVCFRRHSTRIILTNAHSIFNRMLQLKERCPAYATLTFASIVLEKYYVLEIA